MFVGDPTPEDYAAVADEARVAARDSGAQHVVRDGVSIARLVDIGDLDGAATIADQYALTLDDLVVQLGPISPDLELTGAQDVVDWAFEQRVRLMAAGYRIANLCNAGDHDAAQRVSDEQGASLYAIIDHLSGPRD